jgi:hypothetical protein
MNPLHAPRYCREILSGEMYHKLLRRFSKSRQTIFRSIYQSDHWNHGRAGESRSGEGSTVAMTQNVREILARVIRERGVTSFLDAPCGDWNWMRLMDLSGVKYTGGDIVPEVVESNRRVHARPGVEFAVMDLVEGKPAIGAHDLILCRDCIQHLANDEVRRVLTNFSESGSKWLLITTTPRVRQNEEIGKTGLFRPVNLRLAPWNIAEVEEEFVDCESEDPNLQKHLLLLRLPLKGFGA